MNINASKHDQFMSAENNLNTSDVKKTKLEEGHQNISSCYNNEDKSFFKFCKENGVKKFQYDSLQNGTDENGRKIFNIFKGLIIHIYKLVCYYNHLLINSEI